jgi:hypothetical protein
MSAFDPKRTLVRLMRSELQSGGSREGPTNIGLNLVRFADQESNVGAYRQVVAALYSAAAI